MSPGISSLFEQLWLRATLQVGLANLAAKWLLRLPCGSQQGALAHPLPPCPPPSHWDRMEPVKRQGCREPRPSCGPSFCAAYLAASACLPFSPLSPPRVLASAAADGEWQRAPNLPVAWAGWDWSVTLSNSKYMGKHAMELGGVRLTANKKKGTLHATGCSAVRDHFKGFCEWCKIDGLQGRLERDTKERPQLA